MRHLGILVLFLLDVHDLKTSSAYQRHNFILKNFHERCWVAEPYYNIFAFDFTWAGPFCDTVVNPTLH